MTAIEDIYTLIEQGNTYINTEHLDLIESYYTDAWITLKQYLKENNIQSLEEIEEDDDTLINDWFNNINATLTNAMQYEALLDILTDSLLVLTLNTHQVTTIKRSIAECYFNLKDQDLAITKYEEYLKDYPTSDTILYGYGLMMMQMNNDQKAIDLFTSLLSKVDNPDPLLKEATIELLIELYQKIGEEEKANKLKKH